MIVTLNINIDTLNYYYILCIKYYAQNINTLMHYRSILNYIKRNEKY